MRGPGASDHLDLRPALDLEQPHRVAAADAVVHRGVLEVDAREIEWRSLPHSDPLDALLHERQHAERQKVDLDEARVVAGILVPLAYHAVFHGGALERYDLHERPAREDRKSTRLNSSHSQISYAVFCLKKKITQHQLSMPYSETAQLCAMPRRV